MADWRRGSSLTIPLFDLDAAFAGTEPIRAVLKKANANGKPPGDDAPEAAVADISWVAPAGGAKGHWLLSFTAAQGEALTVGAYLLDARIDHAGGVIVTAPLTINVLERVTEPA